ncbi:aryl-alcohol dehydrogenase-like predicted oxidoreductase [Actinoplanes octamycinicus]|uniref:Aryl-alcohol dehydrogenase-like predicted oxidoreductase n=1 Tax=Actinoplanes octamycinicus TaxID=135948 RepID=A0A7W7H0B5_9ACTN|nr:aldo/keto reductase [Actinoplanes octamycinicus]MBB4741625.1 aryl-alcohol dehydrogenase-like predicted oxidoreductase [Actinoplanes octamycinicus]GIE57177.1 oxidoreductase [Actinoplanes octamycinicus]
MSDNTHSPLVLGAMMFGTTVDEETSFALLDRFVERGGVWIDTANCYSFWASDTGHGGDSERVLGRWLAARPGVRDRVRIATKLGAEPLRPGSWPDGREGLSPDAVRRAFAGSLERLGVDRVDLLWLHQEDRSTPIEETVGALAELAADRFGVSNHPAWLVERGRAHARAIGARPFDALQLNATYLRPRPGTLPPGVAHRFGVLSDEQADYAAEHGIDLWAYTPLLSGAYDNPAKAIPEVYDHPGNAGRLKALDEVAAETGAARGQVVLAWLLSRGIRPMLGGSKVHQLDSAFDGVALRLSEEQVRRLDEVDHSPWGSPYPTR